MNTGIKYRLLGLKQQLGLPVSAYPFTLQIYLDSVCNLDCWFCLYKYREDIPQTFDINNIGKLDEAIHAASIISLSSCGEVLSSVYFPAVLKHIYSLNPKPDLISMVTNGLLLTPDTARLLQGHLADLVVSINSKAVKPTREFVSALQPGDRGKTGLHFLAHADNINEIPNLPSMAQDAGVKRIRVDQFMVAAQKHLPLSLLNVKDKYNNLVYLARDTAASMGISFYARTFGSETKKPKCQSPWTECHVWADGRVAPCCYNGNLFLGNAYQSSLAEVWRGEAYQKLRQSGSVECSNCPKQLPFDDPRVHIYPVLQDNANV